MLAARRNLLPPQSMQWALRRATQRAASVGLYCPTGDGGLGILLDAYASQKKMFREMRVEYYGVNPMQSRSSSEVFVLKGLLFCPPKLSQVFIGSHLGR